MSQVREIVSAARSRWRNQRGAVLVEAAIAIPILLTVILGSIEFGFAWEAKSASASGVRTAVLRAASLGDQPQTDMRILQSIIGEVGAENVGQIEYVVIYNSTNVLDEQAAIDGCANNSGTVTCVRYGTNVLTDIAHTTDPEAYQEMWFDNGAGGAVVAGVETYNCETGVQHDAAWCAGSRTINGDVEIGIAMRYQHEWVTGILPFNAPVFNDETISSTFLGNGSVISSSSPLQAGTTVAYTNDFDLLGDGETPFGFSNGTIDNPPASGAPNVLGPFDRSNDDVPPSLFLSGLDPFHTEICVSLDLHVIGGWEDSGGAKDTFHIGVDGTLSSEHTYNRNNTPGNASSEDTFGYPPFGGQDFTVPIQFCTSHSGTEATIDFIGDMTAHINDEGWAISNIQVTTS